MPDTETAETATEQPAETTEENGKPVSSTPDRLPDDHPLVKAYQATKNELSQTKGRVKEFEDANKSEQEKLTERAAELEGKLTAAEANAARFEIALEKGLTKSQAKRLVGNTREELEADADELIADLGVDDESKPSSRRPKERLRPGASNDTEPQKSPQELADEVVKARGY